eukprot:38337-Chlamydomonas_euryale.AAC.7
MCLFASQLQCRCLLCNADLRRRAHTEDMPLDVVAGRRVWRTCGQAPSRRRPRSRNSGLTSECATAVIHTCVCAHRHRPAYLGAWHV